MTPLAHRQRPGIDGFGVSAVPGLVSGTPVPLHGSGRLRQPLRELQHNPRANTESFTGAGLSSHLKTSQGLVGSLAPPVRPRGKLLPSRNSLSYADRSYSCTTARRTSFRIGHTSRQRIRIPPCCLSRTGAGITCRFVELLSSNNVVVFNYFSLSLSVCVRVLDSKGFVRPGFLLDVFGVRPSRLS